MDLLAKKKFSLRNYYAHTQDIEGYKEKEKANVEIQSTGTFFMHTIRYRIL